jgi:predicted phage terminase large subunit-like protein
MPPRHGKSEMVTVRYPVYRMERDPSLRVIVAAHTATLAEKFSRKSRRIAEMRLTLNAERTAAEDWETQQGGGLRAVGVGGGIAGQGAGLVMIDDPTKNRRDAESPTVREHIWDWFSDDLYTRLEPTAAIVLIQTRWHADDLAGRLIAEMEAGGEQWEVVNLPAFAETNDPLGRSEGEALCPERFDVDALLRIKRVLGSSFEALYQQRPVAKSGEFFKRESLTVWGTCPSEMVKRVRYWDKAGSLDGDYTAGVLMAYTREGLWWVLDVVRGRWLAPERERVMRQTAELDGPGVPIVIEQEGGSGGKDSASASIRNLAGFSARAEPASGEKTARAAPLSAQALAGNLKINRAPWNREFIDELCAFPMGKHDDQVDAASGAFNYLARTGKFEAF